MATQQEINEAAERRDETLRRETGAVAVRFDKEARLIVLELNRGFSIYFSPERAQGLENASDEQLAEIEITSSGLGVYFPKLDADFSVPNLVKGRFGNDQWEAAWLAAHPTEAPQGKKSRRSKAA